MCYSVSQLHKLDMSDTVMSVRYSAALK